ncbi:MAG: alpha/beta fold hydrolase [Pseudomonadota bacterium]
MKIEPIEFSPPWGLSGKHAQTILSSVGPRRIRLSKIKRKLGDQSNREVIETAAGVKLLTFFNSSGQQPAQKLVIMIHGWEGSEISSYMLSATEKLLNNGCDVIRLNLRDHGDSHHLNREAFNSTLLPEVIDAVELIQSKYQYPQTHLAGFSLGGNFALRVAADASTRNINLTSVSAFCPVVHAAEANTALSMRRNWLYDAYFVRKWKKSLRLKQQEFPDRYPLDSVLPKLKTLDAMNKALIPQFTEYQILEDYFAAYAITDDRLKNVVCPCYLHFAADDMIIPVEGVNRINKHDSLDIVVTEQGGHCGYLTNWRFESWQDDRLLQIIGSYD